MVLEQMDIHRQKKKKKNFDLNLTHYFKINSKWATDLHAIHRTINLLGKTVGQNFGNLEVGRVLKLDIKNLTHKRKN